MTIRGANWRLKMTMFHFNFKSAQGANYRKYGDVQITLINKLCFNSDLPIQITFLGLPSEFPCFKGELLHLIIK